MDDGFLRGDTRARLNGLLDAPQPVPRVLYPEDASAIAVEGELDHRRVVAVTTDPARASGAIGRADAEVFLAAIRHAQEQRLPLVLLLDSAGAMLTEGVRVLGAFRRLHHALLDARAASLPVAAVLGRNCYGGASLLAYLTDLRICPRGSRLGLSGPRALSVLIPRTYADNEIQALYSCESRARHDEDAVLVTDDAKAVRSVLLAWLAQPRARTDAVARTRIVLTRRLRMYRGDPTTLSTQPPPPELEARLDHLFAQGWSACYSDAVVWGDGWMEGRNTSFAGFVSGRTVDAFGCWRLIEVLREFSRDPAGLPITLLLDSPGQAADVVNEQVILSEFVARVSEILYRLRVQGRTVELWMIGEAGGAIYVALAAAATTITAWPGLRLQTIPPAAVNQVVGQRTDQKPTISALFEARVIDRWTRSPGFGEWPTQPHPPA